MTLNKNQEKRVDKAVRGHGLSSIAGIGSIAGTYGLTRKFAPFLGPALPLIPSFMIGSGVESATLKALSKDKKGYKDVEKLDEDPSSFMKHIQKKASVKDLFKNPTIIGSLFGAGIGAPISYSGAKERYSSLPEKQRKKMRRYSAVTGAIGGGLVGGGLGSHLKQSISGSAFKRSRSGSSGSGYKWEDFFRDRAGARAGARGASHGKNIYDVMPGLKKVRTKADARKYHRSEILKVHPDKHGGKPEFVKRTQELNDTWDRFRKSSDWSKLAFLFPVFRR